ncbi:MAG: tRNA epoxyqueuosine(34) reductase QueG [Gammaproteobacteria bacterium]|nr:tRNA epoxyqueuosine(34) reductase QueG [Gammaproteobacteria bacterium]MDH5651024.1 tRNA epoxyqueuosine(34) reductase QueG [Gammaproteobacteria bacterium]
MSLPPKQQLSAGQLTELAAAIKQWGEALGFQQTGITDTDLQQAEQRLSDWLAHGYHGAMNWMADHGSKRSRPAELVANTIRIISVRMNYRPAEARAVETLLHQPQLAYISRYALGRDYHKLMRNRLQQLATRIEQQIGPFGYRVFVDSAPVLEKPIAEKAGLGWVGKHSNLLNREAGSWFFLGEIYIDLPLPTDSRGENHCGTCTSCMDVCPTRAIVAPYIVDAQRCISYLTIELPGAIPVELRPLLGNRIYGCDDCQLFCPWNRFAHDTDEADFLPRQQLDEITLLELFSWDEQTFLDKLAGSAIRRIGHERWLRNIAVALGNGPASSAVLSALEEKRSHPSPLVREHVEWALAVLSQP